MQVQIEAAILNGSITIPSSKSAMQRACAAALLNNGTTYISRPGISNDDLAALSIIQQLGAIVLFENDKIVIKSKGLETIKSAHPEKLNCGESGLGIRMFTSIAALSDNKIIIDGEGSLKQRPMHFFEEVFSTLNVIYQSSKSYTPLQVQGPLIAKNIKVDGSKSSQYITGLIMAYASITTKETIIEIEDLKSKPYIDLTLSIMRHFKMNIPENDAYKRLIFQPTIHQQQKKEIHYTVEADWSSASFLLVAGAINGSLIIRGLDIKTTQADIAILNALMLAGANLKLKKKQISIVSNQLQAFDFDATDCPDLFPPLVVLAAHCKGVSRIKGIKRLIHKESDREQSLKNEFTKLGVKIHTEDDYMIITGGNQLKGCMVSSHNDHRIAMALSIAALKATGQTIIVGAEAVKKSYPDFYRDLQRLLGVAINLNENKL